MSSRRLTLQPSADRPLRDLLLAEGVEFPCGGEGTCGECRIRVVRGDVSVTPAMREFLSEEELRAGWRLGCCAPTGADAAEPVELEVRQWQTAILGDDAPVAIDPRPGFGAAVDLGTTTVVVQCVDLLSGEIVGTQSALNVQVRYGADLMSRVQYALTYPGVLTERIREQIGVMLSAAADGREITEVLLVGNTAMHHLFCGEAVEPLAAVPFRSEAVGARRFSGNELGWAGQAGAAVTFLPCVGGFVGSDLLVGLLASGLAVAGQAEALFDLGTNGEIAVTTGSAIVCASTAAGPAFEGGRISCGMRAGPGAIHRVDCAGDGAVCHVIGGGSAHGVCGSGLLDAVACALEAGEISCAGRLRAPDRGIALTGDLRLTQRDIRELQLAKGAIASGLALLQQAAGVGDLQRIHLAGAFGNFLRERSARRTGLLPAAARPSEGNGGGCATVHPAGNAALRGARMLLLQPESRDGQLAGLLARISHLELASQPGFQEAFVEALGFPESAL